ncbi:LLM class flavin-dependent oxidoreductase [Nocardiopsis ansamitocini]|uniref:N5,N10-methylene tetrahydromethanopterin reductase n=1 Tax=Nocardiopsis ansamitocini TaxID=1670832 RepID=A0A9W6UJN0_9ACTN|nr:LLM class flavin-dependent oxidoreductase [Nocardiopsis ansamitocini]GLU48230.1 N5,N10-methylene tetrahydromethanopterin reductase [Nocardiopsis ansamitocini]
MNRPQLGVQIPCTLPAARTTDLARAVESAGFDEVWLVEDCFFTGGIATSAMALAATERVRVGIGILPAVARNAAFTAMELAALAQAHPGRLTAGLGHGVGAWMRQIGAAPASPLTALGEHLDAVRRLLAGEEVTVQGRYVRLDAVRLDLVPEQPPLVLAGVRGPKSLEVSGRYADGTLLAEPVSRAYLTAARASIQRGQGVDTRPHPVTVYTFFHTDDDPVRARDALRPKLAAAVANPAWAAHLEPLGLGERLTEVAALPEEQRGAAIPDSWIDELAVVGTIEDCARQIAGLHAAGAHSVVLTPIGDTVEQLRRAAPLNRILAG